jgi:hypothetical protein
MRRTVVCLFAGLTLCPALLLGQQCKVKFAVAYTDGKDLRVGLTEEQAKFWKQDGAKKFKGMCLDAEKPDYLVLWTEGLSGAELLDSTVANFNRGRATGENTTLLGGQSGAKGGVADRFAWTDRTAFICTSGEVKATADYWIFDTSKKPYATIRRGQGFQDIPLRWGQTNRPGDPVKSSDYASTIADPKAALENALKWLKREKKL